MRTVEIAEFSVGRVRPPMPSEPPPALVLQDRQRSPYEATLAAATDYYRKSLIDWWTWQSQLCLGQKADYRLVASMRAELVAFFQELVHLGFARWGMVPMPMVAEISLDFCIVDVDAEYRPIRTPHRLGLDIEPLSERLAAYWMGSR